MISKERLEEMAKNETKLLVSLIKEGRLSNSELTFALKYLGIHNPYQHMFDFIFRFLDHIDLVVREGAVYGLGEIYEYNDDIVVNEQKILQVLEKDSLLAKICGGTLEDMLQ